MRGSMRTRCLTSLFYGAVDLFDEAIKSSMTDFLGWRNSGYGVIGTPLTS